MATPGGRRRGCGDLRTQYAHPLNWQPHARDSEAHSSMSNAPWNSKRDELQEHSVLLLNNELLTRSTWDEETIRSRSRRVAELVSTRWPGPTSEEWSEIK